MQLFYLAVFSIMTIFTYAAVNSSCNSDSIDDGRGICLRKSTCINSWHGTYTMRHYWELLVGSEQRQMLRHTCQNSSAVKLLKFS